MHVPIVVNPDPTAEKSTHLFYGRHHRAKF